jgi:hypothetical protein
VAHGGWRKGVGRKARGHTADRGSLGRKAVRGRKARGASEGGDREDGRAAHGAWREAGGARARGREVSGIRARGEGEKKGLTGARQGCWSCAVFAFGARAGGGGRDARAPGGVGARCGVRDARAPGGEGERGGVRVARARGGALARGEREWGAKEWGGWLVCRSRNAGLGTDCRTTAVMRVRSGGPPNAMLGSRRTSRTDRSLSCTGKRQLKSPERTQRKEVACEAVSSLG